MNIVFSKRSLSRLTISIFCIILFERTTPARELNSLETDNPSHSFTFYWENDLFSRADKNYSNGIKLTWSSLIEPKDEQLNGTSKLIHNVFNRLPFSDNPNSRKGISFSLGHSIYTPEDTERTDLIEDDRPYAGYLYSNIAFHANHGRRLEDFEFRVGIVGPLSMAEELQNAVHKMNGDGTAKGWAHQLDNEPVVELAYQSKWRLWELETKNNFGLGIISHLGAHLGNVATYANSGFEFRWGWRLPDDFGSCPIKSGCEVNSIAAFNNVAGITRRTFSAHWFLSIDGRIMLHDIFIDGNTFRDSHSVDRKVLVADVATGLAIYFRKYRLSYSYVLRTRQFKQQEENEIFGAITFAFIY